MNKYRVPHVARARQQPPDGPAFAGSRDRTDPSLGWGGPVRPSRVRRRGNWAEKRGCQWSRKSNSGSPFAELDGETRLSAAANIMEWVSITALPSAVTWHPFVSYLLAAGFAVCGGALAGVLALFFNKPEIETHFDVDNRSIPRGENCETASVAVLSVTVNASETLMPDTINTGTRLIEEGALLPGSVQSESEAWTAFYMAGEIIRELRKAQEIKQVGNPCSSGFW